LYEGVRCGFAHEGFLKERKTRKCNIIIASQGEDKNPIKYDKSKKEMIIYAKGYVNEIQKEFKDYYGQLENDKTKLYNFLEVWKQQWEMKGDEIKLKQVIGTFSSN
jgi:hypothetical protein